mgnify:CR=1 FL=1
MADQVRIQEYYTVCLRPYDPGGTADSLLGEARRKFFGGEKTVRGSVRAVEDGRETRTRYRLSRGCFHWKKICAGAVLEEAFPSAEGGYRMLTHRADGRLVSAAIYDAAQRWARTIYYDGDPLHPAAVLERTAVGMNLRTAKGAAELLPCPWEPGSAEQSFVNAKTGEPYATARTDAGGFCFCPAANCAQRMEVGQKLKESPESFVPEWPGPQEGETLRFRPIPNAPETAGPLAQDAGESAEKTAPCPIPEGPGEAEAEQDYAADHELYSVSTEPPAETHPARYAVAAKGLSGAVRGGLRRREMRRMEPEPSKRIVVSADESYLYFGRLIGEMRQGHGRTQMAGGHTAYEGGYRDDQRDGFGVYYCKSGRLSYAGGWKKNQRDGLGVAFSPDGTVFVGNWKEGAANGIGTEFDLSGRPVRTGVWRSGKYIGPENSGGTNPER